MGGSDTQKTVVVAESDAELQKIIGYTLRAYTENIVTVSDGHEALTAMATLAPFLIILDLNLPQIATSNLLDVVNTRLDANSLFAIVTTSYSLRDIRHMLHPDCGVLKKPFDVAALRAAIEEQLA